MASMQEALDISGYTIARLPGSDSIVGISL